jgi:hypothetical protein
MSIFRETFPQFIKNELDRRQDGMATRDPVFLQQLNTRNAWVRMTSGVNTINASGTYNNDLASNYVLQGGTLSDNKLRTGLGGNGTSTYDTFSPGGVKHRLGIRPMPGITNVSIQSKGAYGSLQEATVSFNCWDIKQLEDLELLYMRPGYTVLLEFGWDFAKKVNGTLPKYDILNAQEGLTLNKAFADIYEKIEQSNGTYDALLGYVKNYNWSARDDGGYDCTTTIISLGEVLESLKVNWVPLETNAFDVSGSGLLKQNSPTEVPEIIYSYEQGIIPGLLHELWDYMDRKAENSELSYSRTFNDPTFGTPYYLYMSKQMSTEAKNDRGGLPKPLGTEVNTEGWITLGSFCDLLNNYVLIKSGKNNPLSKIITYETDTKGNILKEDYQGQLLPKSLKCIASPLAISTNLGVCLVRNDRWASLSAEVAKEETKTDQKNTPSFTPPINPSIQSSIAQKNFNLIGLGIIVPKITRNNKDLSLLLLDLNLLSESTYKYNGNIKEDLKTLVADQLLNNIVDIKLIKTNSGLKTQYIFSNKESFISNNNSTTNINFFDYFFSDRNADENVALEAAYQTLFFHSYTNADGSTTSLPKDPFEGNVIESATFIDNTNKPITKKEILKIIKDIFTNYPLNSRLRTLSQAQVPVAATAVADEAEDTPGISFNTLLFLYPDNSLDLKTVGRISNIYVNINYLYSQAVSKNVASNDTQNTNNISIREYLQSILRDIQNSLGNINDFDIQVDNRTAIGRIVDLNFTANPSEFTGEKSLFQLQIHNTNSVVRKYGFQSKIFPEMGSIIAISAQDPSGIGKLGYDNATLVAWNEGVRDRLIPKKDFTPEIQISDGGDPASFILPFLTKMVQYFNVLQGQSTANINYAYGGLDFSYRDFLANLNRFDRRNDFKTIIPTELNITLDGIGGMVIGNLFTINQDIVPKGYRNTGNRKLAYIVTKLGHSISDNDWVTDLGAYPVVFENATGTNVAKKWNNQKYPGDFSIKLGSTTLATITSKSTGGFDKNAIKTAMNFFIGKGFSIESAAALVGSFLQESQLNPKILNINDKKAYNADTQTYAAGIAQWVGPRRVDLLEFAKSNGINIPNYDAALKIRNNRTKTPQSGNILTAAFSNMTLDVQLNFVIKEIPGYDRRGKKVRNTSYQQFKTSKNLQESILWVYEVYEGGNYTEGADIGRRGPWAADLVKRYNAGEFK